MTDEWRHLSGADAEADSRVHHVREEGDAVLEVVPLNLHHAGGMLHNGHLGRQEHFGGAVQQAVDGLAGRVSTKKMGAGRAGMHSPRACPSRQAR